MLAKLTNQQNSAFDILGKVDQQRLINVQGGQIKIISCPQECLSFWFTWQIK
ncbi:hypothetical protein FDUTEX481_05376 [Tolypothrix sp. PCC 7601]|nr:hypothetical protein FDUTEX481_05376 [Tolypothrix sp. PCC 7601]